MFFITKVMQYRLGKRPCPNFMRRWRENFDPQSLAFACHVQL